MKKIALLLGTLAIGFSFGCASNEPKAAKTMTRPAYELLEIMDISKTISQMNTQLRAQMKAAFIQQFADNELPPEVMRIMDNYLDQASDLMMSSITWDKLKPQFADIYEKVYTREQLHELVAFYRTDLGQLTLEKMPELMTESMAISQKEMQRLMPEFRQIMNKMANEIKEYKESM